jgi:MSHA biogenesis protein MshE
MTGHTVLSTLHTNDAPSTPVRLLDMGVPGYMIATTLRGVVAQRLLRVTCTYCAEPYEPSANERAWVEHYSTTESCRSAGFSADAAARAAAEWVFPAGAVCSSFWR